MGTYRSFPSLLRISSCSCDAPMLWWWEYESLIMSYKLVACTTNFFHQIIANDLSAILLLLFYGSMYYWHWKMVFYYIYIYCVSIAAYTTFIWFTQFCGFKSLSIKLLPYRVHINGINILFFFSVKIICLLISHDLFI